MAQPLNLQAGAWRPQVSSIGKAVMPLPISRDSSDDSDNDSTGKSTDPSTPAEFGNDGDDAKNEVIGSSFEAPPGALLDVDVEDLMERLHEARLQDSFASSQKSTRYVPADYSMQMQVDSETYQNGIAHHRAREQNRVQKGFPRLTSRKKKLQHGFDPVQVIRKYAISLPKRHRFRQSTLDNDILPLFRFENFHDCALDVYEQLKPALRLSSLFLTHRATSSFWHTLAYGKRKVCAETSQKHNRKCIRISEDVPWDKSKADYLRTYFDTLTKRVHFHFDLLKDPTITPSYTYGFCAVVKDYKSALPTNAGIQNMRVCLHTDFYTTAKRLSLLNPANVDAAMLLRFTFFLAVNITHEIAHFFEIAHNFPMRAGEVFLNDNNWAESGAAFEKKVFGGRIHPVSARIDCAYGLATYDWPIKDERDGDEAYNMLWTVPMEYIARIQQASTWEKHADSSDPTVFYVPRSGARSIGFCALDMTIWEDEASADLVDDALQTLNAPLRRLFNGDIVKGTSSGHDLRRTRTGRITKPTTRKMSGNMQTWNDADKNITKLRSGVSPKGLKGRRVRLPTRRRAMARPLPRKKTKSAKTKTKDMKNETPSPPRLAKQNETTMENPFAALDSMPIE